MSDTEYYHVTPQDLGLGLFDGDPDAAKRKAISASKFHSRVLQSRQCVNAFAEYAIRDRKGNPFRQADLHREMQARMDDENKHTLVEVSRNHGKTNQGVIRVLHKTGNNPNRVTKIVCETDPLANNRLGWIKEQIEDNDCVHDVFPTLKPGKKWQDTRISVERTYAGIEPTIEAKGVLGSATGGRTDELLLDDPVGMKNSITTPALRSVVRQKINGDWLHLLEPESVANVLCTGWTNDDWVHDAKNNPAWSVFRRPTENFKSPWPEKWPEKALREKLELIKQVEYDRGFRLIPLSGDIVAIDPDWIEYWRMKPDISRLILFTAYDIAPGESKKGDYFAPVVVGLDPKPPGVFYVIRAIHSRPTVLEQVQMVISETAAVLPDFIGMEAVQYQAVLPTLIQATTSALPNIIRINPRLSKALRLAAVAPLIQEGKVLFNPSMRPERIKDPEGNGCLVSEITSFPLGRYDDMLDAFVYAMTMALEYLLQEIANQQSDDNEDDERATIKMNIDFVGGSGEESIPENKRLSIVDQLNSAEW